MQFLWLCIIRGEPCAPTAALSSEMQHVPCLLAPSEQSFDLLLIQWRNGEGYKSQYWPRQCSPWRQSWFWWTSPAGNKIKKTGVELDKNCTVRVCRIFLLPSGTGHFKYHFAWWQRRGGGLNAYIRRSQVNRSEGISGMSVVSSQWMCGCVNVCVCPSVYWSTSSLLIWGSRWFTSSEHRVG